MGHEQLTYETYQEHINFGCTIINVNSKENFVLFLHTNFNAVNINQVTHEVAGIPP